MGHPRVGDRGNSIHRKRVQAPQRLQVRVVEAQTLVWWMAWGRKAADWQGLRGMRRDHTLGPSG